MKPAWMLLAATAGFWWWRSDPDVEKGNAKAQEGQFEEALADFDRAGQSLSNEEQQRQLAFDRGLALHGAGKTDEAQKAFAYAAQSEDPVLRSRAAFNEGNVALGKKDSTAAVQAYIRSLRADPGYAPAKRNLEILLTQPPPPPDGGSDGNDGGGGDGGSDGGGGGQGDGGGDGGSPPDGGQGDGGQGADGGSDNDRPPPMDDPQQPPPQQPQRLDEQDAMNLLDAMQDAEKNRPLGRIMLRDNKPRRSTKEW
ncbi:MAG: hypothetical protein HY904_12570 [Deltaproteobacteria bacterium]|nr:hypothetical protein [Deltaproteobacteria bacterium]